MKKIPPKITSDWKTPRRSQRLRNKVLHQQSNHIELSNRYILPPPSTKKASPRKVITESYSTTKQGDVIHNLSNSHLTTYEESLLEKGLNFTPTTKRPNVEKALEDTYDFCRKMRLKEFFDNQENKKETCDNQDEEKNEERSNLDIKSSNPFFYPTSKASDNLELYLSSVKKDVTDLLNSKTYVKSNLSEAERCALKSLQSRNDIVINSADKGGRIVILDRKEYIDHCEMQLNNETFYEKLEVDPNSTITEDITAVIDGMSQKKYLSKKESKFLSGNLSNPNMPYFYGLAKIHKKFEKFPPLRPIVSQVN